MQYYYFATMLLYNTQYSTLLSTIFRSHSLVLNFRECQRVSFLLSAVDVVSSKQAGDIRLFSVNALCCQQIAVGDIPSLPGQLEAQILVATYPGHQVTAARGNRFLVSPVPALHWLGV